MITRVLSEKSYFTVFSPLPTNLQWGVGDSGWRSDVLALGWTLLVSPAPLMGAILGDMSPNASGCGWSWGVVCAGHSRASAHVPKPSPGLWAEIVMCCRHSLWTGSAPPRGAISGAVHASTCQTSFWDGGAHSVSIEERGDNHKGRFDKWYLDFTGEVCGKR